MRLGRGNVAQLIPRPEASGLKLSALRWVCLIVSSGAPLPFLPVENFPQDGAGRSLERYGADDGLGNCKNCTLMHVIAKKRTQIYALREGRSRGVAAAVMTALRRLAKKKNYKIFNFNISGGWRRQLPARTWLLCHQSHLSHPPRPTNWLLRRTLGMSLACQMKFIA